MLYEVITTVQPSGHEFFVEGNDTVLEAALRAGIPLNYGCSNGNCGDCKVRLVSGQVQKVHPHDFALKEAEKANGDFLMCSYTPVTDIVIEANVRITSYNVCYTKLLRCHCRCGNVRIGDHCVDRRLDVRLELA